MYVCVCECVCVYVSVCFCWLVGRTLSLSVSLSPSICRCCVAFECHLLKQTVYRFEVQCIKLQFHRALPFNFCLLKRVIMNFCLFAVNLDSWQHKLDTGDIGTSAPEKHEYHDDGIAHGNPTDCQSQAVAAYSGFAGLYQKFRDGILTIGCIGWCTCVKSYFLCVFVMVIWVNLCYCTLL